jgi:hypothetical protein
MLSARDLVMVIWLRLLRRLQPVLNIHGVAGWVMPYL